MGKPNDNQRENFLSMFGDRVDSVLKHYYLNVNRAEKTSEVGRDIIRNVIAAKFGTANTTIYKFCEWVFSEYGDRLNANYLFGWSDQMFVQDVKPVMQDLKAQVSELQEKVQDILNATKSDNEKPGRPKTR